MKVGKYYIIVEHISDKFQNLFNIKSYKDLPIMIGNFV